MGGARVIEQESQDLGRRQRPLSLVARRDPASSSLSIEIGQLPIFQTSESKSKNSIRIASFTTN